MREKLASARHSSHLEPTGWAVATIAASARASTLGIMLSRGLDNGDSAALRRAVYLLARDLKRQHKIEGGYASRAAQIVIRKLIQPLCGVCGGRKYREGENGVQSICGGCGGSGRAVYRDKCGDRVLELGTVLALAALRNVIEVTKKSLEKS